jgi:hypothetical protein
LLSQKAMPYQAKALEAKSKVDQFWAQPNWIQALTQLNENRFYRFVLKTEVDLLSQISNPEQKTQIEALAIKVVLPSEELKQIAAKPTLQEVKVARENVVKSPMNRDALMTLKSLEAQNGNHTMAQYLDGRISRLEKEAKQ